MVEASIVGTARAAGRFRRGAIALGGVAILVLAIPGQADDTKKSGDASKAGRLLVQEHQARSMKLLSVDPDTGESKPAGEFDSPGGKLSPDGRYLLRNHGRPGTPDEGLWIHDLAGKNPPRKVFDRFGIASWPSQGDHIIIGCFLAGGKYETYRIKPDGTGLTRLTIPETDFVEDCSQDGAWIAAREKTDGRTRINVMHPDGSERHAVVDEPNMPSADYWFSPDGKKLAYVKIDVEDNMARCSLWVVDAGGRERKQVPITFEPGLLVQFRWAPDGHRFGIGLREQGAQRKAPAELADDRIVVVDIDGKNRRTLLSIPGAGPLRLFLLDWK